MSNQCRPAFFTRLILLSTWMLFSINASAQQGPTKGLRITDVNPGGPAAEAGMQSTDVIVMYGDAQVVDAASYFVARERYQKSSQGKIEITYWRGRDKAVAQVLPGTLGIRFDDFNPGAYELEALMQRLNAMIEAPAYLTEAQAARASQSRAKLLDEIEAAIQKASGEGLLTPAQILVARINAIPDDSPAPAIERQSAMLKELMANQTRGFIEWISYEVFFKHKRYRAAVSSYQKVLETNRADAGSRLNLGIAYNHLEMFAEAETAADYALKQYGGLTQHGYVVAFQVKAGAALGLREFAKAADYAQQSFEVDPPSGYPMLLWLLAAAQTGDMGKFYDAVTASQKRLPSDYSISRARIDMLEAYVLFKNGQLEKAQTLARKWATDETNATYWQQFPSGADVVKVSKQLVSQK
jgi:tetratricopeptide (TPR) repeat protein